MNTHKVVLQVELIMTEMDGTAEQSAEIAMEIVSEAIAKEWDNEAKVSVIAPNLT